MGLFTVGIFIASVVFLIYKIRPLEWTSINKVPAAGQRNPSDSKREHANGVLPSQSKMDDTTASPNEGSDSGSSTPKAEATPSLSLPDVPVFSIDEDTTAFSPKVALSTAPIPSTVNTRPKSISTQKTARELMPPPSVKPSSLRPLPKLNGSLVPPPSAASSLRGPPGATLSANSLSPAANLSTSTLPPTKRASRKVILEPGHSALDWAALKHNPPTPTFLRGAEVPLRLVKILPSEVKARNGRKGKDAWGTWQGKVYNLTPYMRFHPGGVGELMRGAGKIGEAERLFNEIHPWVNWDGMLAECLIGILVSETEVGEVNKMEEMD